MDMLYKTTSQKRGVEGRGARTPPRLMIYRGMVKNMCLGVKIT